jgi:hypothetical protein
MKDYGALKYEQWGPNPKYGGRHVQRPEPQHKDVNTTLSSEQLSNLGVLSQKTGPINSREFGKFSGLLGNVEGPEAVGSPDRDEVKNGMILKLAETLGIDFEELKEAMGIPKGLSGSYDIKTGEASIGKEWDLSQLIK